MYRLRREAPAASRQPSLPCGKEGREKVEKICVECGAEFRPLHGSQVCCSDKCKAARKKRLDDNRYQFRDQKSESAFREERREKARRRAEFFAARDALAPKPKTEIIERNGIIIERRGTVPAGCHAVGVIKHT